MLQNERQGRALGQSYNIIMDVQVFSFPLYREIPLTHNKWYPRAGHADTYMLY